MLGKREGWVMETGQEIIMYGGYRIKPKSERVHASVRTAGWRPVAEVSVEREGSVLIRRIEPMGIPLASSKEEADKIAVKAARSWIEKRAAFGENLSEAALILKEWIKRN